MILGRQLSPARPNTAAACGIFPLFDARNGWLVPPRQHRTGDITLVKREKPKPGRKDKHGHDPGSKYFAGGLA